MNKIIQIDNYLFDYTKFLSSISTGDYRDLLKYKTDIFGIESKNRKGFITTRVYLDYSITKDFIIDNLDILRDKGIVKIRIRK